MWWFGNRPGALDPKFGMAPDRLDLSERNARLAKERGVKIIISTDSHHTRHFANIRYGVKMARRAWLEPRDVLNTLPLDRFRQALKRE